MLVHTLVLVAGVGAGTLLLGAGLAWLVTAYRFPASRLFDKLLILPLAMPAYVLAFVFMSTFDSAGPVQWWLRGQFGPAVQLREVRTGFSAILVMVLVLYPYVYLIARAAFRAQSAAMLDLACTLGYTRPQAFWRLIVPLARPALAAGTTLAMLEAMTDFATVRFFNVPTLTEGVFRVWEGMMDRQAATELAALLLFAALMLIVVERRLRGQARYYQAAGGARTIEPVALRGPAAWGAVLVCALVFGTAFVLPAAQLVAWALGEIQRGAPGAFDGIYRGYALTTVLLATLGALTVVLLALALALGARLGGGRPVRLAIRAATLGYAMPGAVIAAGTLIVVATLDQALADLARRWFGIDTGLLLTGSIAALIYAYTVRFMAIAYGGIETGLERVTPRMEEAARSLGVGTGQTFRRVHLPLIGTGVAAGAALVFVDVMKELPATLLLRPFGMDTLAVWTYMLASESFWEMAAVPALTILLVGIGPVIWLLRVGTKT
jgi:iron(III) transport system permease protein